MNKKELVETICAELGYSKEEIRDSLSHLRKHALEKLAAKQRADWITLKIRLSSSTTNNVCVFSGIISIDSS